MIKQYHDVNQRLYVGKECGTPSGERLTFIYQLQKDGEYKLMLKTDTPLNIVAENEQLTELTIR